MLRESGRMAAGFAWVPAVAVAWLLFGPSRAKAQDCVACTDVRVWVEDDRKYKHGHIAKDSPHGIHDRGDGTHPDVMWPGWCSDNHPVACGPGGIDGVLYDQSGKVLDAVLEAVSAGDALEAYRIVLREPKESPVRFVPERTAIQVLGCGEHVIAHIPLAHLATAEFLAVVEGVRRARSAP